MLAVTFTAAAVLSLLAASGRTLNLDVDDLQSIREATSLLATGLMDYYHGHDYGETVGKFSDPYYWWEAGGAWGSILDYWYYMENSTYNDLLTDSLLHQAGEDLSYTPWNETTTEGNDDQFFWGMAVMAAAERNFPNPPADQPQWLALAQAVFNTMALRWDMETCNGGLRWQIFRWNDGYHYKNSVSNGALFHMAARLTRYTGNATYLEWAERVYDWMYGVGLISIVQPNWHFVYDGTDINDNCTNLNKLQWTYNHGLIMAGCAFIYNHTQDELWHQRTLRFLDSARIFLSNDTLYEAGCQGGDNCNIDQRSFKAYFSRFLGLTAQLVPESRETIVRWIRASAQGAAASCSGGRDGHTCGLNWLINGWDGKWGLGEQMAALEIIQNLRCLERPAPYTAMNGGTSPGDPAAGTKTKAENLPPLDIKAGDRAGAGIITALIGSSFLACTLWLII
ncbi:FABR060Wp [Eremothecium gossypii FDAG1]|nr:FABR060Wp [Eremothecium gossypii FDAG1]